MSLMVELIGAPGSGKSYFFNNFPYFNKDSSLDAKKQYLKNFFFDQYFKKRKHSKNFKNKFYSYYVKKIQIKSNYLFKKEYTELNKYISKELKKHENYKTIISIYKNYLSTSNYTEERKFRMIKNFEVDYLGFFQKRNFVGLNIFDEGFLQKIFINYQGSKNLIYNKTNQLKYLKLIPKPDLVIYFDTDIRTCINRVKKRKDGFLYEAEKLKYVSLKNYYNKNIISFLKKNKIPILKLDGTKSCRNNTEVFIKKINLIKKN